MSKDFETEKVLNKMKEIRENRDLELFNIELREVNKGDYQKEASKNKVLNVKYLGKIELINNEKIKEEKDIYLVIEQKENKNGELIEIERYYDGDGNVIGGNNKSDNYDFIMLSENYKNREDILKQLTELEKDGEIFDLNELEQEELEEIARSLGIRSEDIERLTEIEADKELSRDEKDKEIEKLKDEDSEKEEFSKKEIEKISKKTEIKTNQKVTDKETIASVLKVEDKGYKKIAIVDSSKLKDNNNTTSFTVVGIKQDGSAEKIDSLEQGYGNAPTKKINSVNRDGTEIEEQQVQSIFKIKGENEKQIGVRIGTIEPSLIRTPRQDNEEAISIPIETHSVKPTTRETRMIMNQQKNVDMTDEIERIKAHRLEGDDERGQEINLKDIDNDPTNDTHVHINNEHLDILADKVLENDNISFTFNREDVKIKIVEIAVRSENDDISVEQLIEKVVEEMEAQAEQEHEQPGQKR